MSTGTLLQDGTDLTVVDAGMPKSWASLESALSELGRSPSDVKALVLTHAHFDHVGFAERLRRDWAVPVFVHMLDAPLTTHPLKYDHERSTVAYAWRPATVGVLASFIRWGMLSTPPIADVKTFADHDTLDVPGHPRVVFTPGHTYGHCSLHLADRDCLIAGDVIVQTDPVRAAARPADGVPGRHGRRGPEPTQPRSDRRAFGRHGPDRPRPADPHRHRAGRRVGPPHPRRLIPPSQDFSWTDPPPTPPAASPSAVPAVSSPRPC